MKLAEGAPDGAFLDRFAFRARSAITNLFLDAIRRHGARTAADVLRQVQTVARRRWDAHFAGPDGRLGMLLRLREAFPTAAALFAQKELDWETLPPAPKRTRKLERATRYARPWMQAQSPTERPVACLRALGYRGAIEDRAHARDLIDAFIRGREGR